MADNLSEEQLRNLAEAFTKLADTINPADEEMKKLAAEAEKTRAAWGKFGKGLATSADQMSKAFMKASDGAGKYAGSIESLSGATSSLLGNFGLVGKAAGFIVDIFGKLAGASLKQNQALEKTYRALSDVGEIGTPYKEFKDRLLAAGLDIQEQNEVYINAVKDAAPNLSAFAGSVGEGSKRIASMGEKLKDSEYELGRFGYSLVDAFPKVAKVVSSLAFTNDARKKSDAELTKIGVRYLENMTALADITGMSREQQEANMREQQNDLRLQMYMSGLRADEAANLKAFLSTQTAENRKGMVSLLVNAGEVVDEEGASIVQRMGRKTYDELIRVQKAESGKYAETSGRIMVDQAIRQQDTFKKMGKVISAGGAEGAKSFAGTAEEYNQSFNVARADVEETVKKQKKALDAQTKSDTDATVARTRAERAFKNSYEELAFKIGQFVIPALEKFEKAVFYIGKRFAELLKKFGGPDITSFFRNFDDFTDVAEALKEEQQEQAKIQARLNDLNKTNEQNEKEILALEEKKKTKMTDMDRLMTERKLSRAYGYRDEHKKLIEEEQAKLKASQGRASEAQSRGQSMAATAAGRATETGTDALAGLRIKQGDVHTQGATLDPKIVEIAKKVQESIPGFAYFSSFNDKYHQENSKGSLHAKGKAFDFVLDHMPTPEESKKIQEQLKQWGASYVRDEYADPSSKATGGHIHAQLAAKTGGIFTGPESGYWVQLHGKEQVTVDPRVDKKPLDTSEQDLSGYFTTMTEQFATMTQQLDALVDYMRKSNGIQDEILTYTKA